MADTKFNPVTDRFVSVEVVPASTGVRRNATPVGHFVRVWFRRPLGGGSWSSETAQVAFYDDEARAHAEAEEFLNDVITRYLNVPSHHGIGDIHTCTEIIAAHDPGTAGYCPALVRLAAESIAEWAGDYGVQFGTVEVSA